MKSRHLHNWGFGIALGMLIAAPAVSSCMGVALLFQLRLLEGVVLLLSMPVFWAWHWYDARYAHPHPRELIVELAKSYACGVPLGLLVAAARWFFA